MLRADDISAGYGPIEIIRGLSLSIDQGEVVAVLGRNGAGKTTLVNTLMGFLPARAGSVTIDGTDCTRARTHTRAARGLAVVPQGRRVFGSLTVDETIALAARDGGWSREAACAAFPRLHERRGTKARSLSGGEQSALAMVRALATGPRLLLLDEPSEGMSPHVLRTLAGVIVGLRAEGVGVLLVEQNLGFALTVADRVLVMARGQICAELSGDEARARPEELSHHLILQAPSGGLT